MPSSEEGCLPPFLGGRVPSSISWRKGAFLGRRVPSSISWRKSAFLHFLMEGCLPRKSAFLHFLEEGCLPRKSAFLHFLEEGCLPRKKSALLHFLVIGCPPPVLGGRVPSSEEGCLEGCLPPFLGGRVPSSLKEGCQKAMFGASIQPLIRVFVSGPLSTSISRKILPSIRQGSNNSTKTKTKKCYQLFPFSSNFSLFLTV